MSDGSFLGRMADSSRLRAAHAKRLLSPAELRARLVDAPLPPPIHPHQDGFDVIAEVKMRSPAEGVLTGSTDGDGIDRPAEQAARRAADYAGAGAVAVSVLTEPSEFQGSLDHLEAAARASSVPVMRKDFLVDAYQIDEARLHGAGGVLLIVGILEGSQLEDLAGRARELGMFSLVEAFDAPELERATAAARAFAAEGPEEPPVLVGLNCRDLKSLAVRSERFEELADAIPEGVACIAESGMHTPSDAARVAALGYDGALVGSALMRATDPAVTLQALIEAGRGAKTECPEAGA